MDKVRIYRSGTQVEVDPTSIPDATSLDKGAVKQGASVAKISDPYIDGRDEVNSIIDSLRYSGTISNTKYRMIYDPNIPSGVSSDNLDGLAWDNNIYEAGDTVYVNSWSISLSGYEFKGWSTNKNAVIPEYSYDSHEQGTDYQLTFTNNDITLYAIWEAISYTLTYSLGDYGSGSVPSPQNAPEGTEINISFSPAPTVNDGSGRVFVGWSTADGRTSYSEAEYRQDGSTTITIYSDTTLYPVFCSVLTLTYSLGSDATGSVPSAQTAYYGQTISVDFMTYPTCVSDSTRAFIGWNTSDRQSVAMYSAMGTSSIYMTDNVTLYPAFEAAQVSYTVTYSNGML